VGENLLQHFAQRPPKNPPLPLIGAIVGVAQAIQEIFGIEPLFGVDFFWVGAISLVVTAPSQSSSAPHFP
jgi:hypothetical protein